MREETRKILLRKLEGNYVNPNRFAETSGVPFSSETIRRAFMAKTGKNVGWPALGVIAYYLGFQTTEIMEMIKKENDPIANIFLKMMQPETLNSKEQAILDILRKVKIAEIPEASELIVTQLRLLGAIAGINITEELVTAEKNNVSI